MSANIIIARSPKNARGFIICLHFPLQGQTYAWGATTPARPLIRNLPAAFGAPFHKEGGRPQGPPTVYFRTILPPHSGQGVSETLMCGSASRRSS